MITLLYGCGHIELAVPDARAARDYFQRVLGAQAIEQDLAACISGHVLTIEHMACGQAVFQFCSPLPGHDQMPAKRHLDHFGAGLTNLNWYVDDTAHARQLLLAMGATEDIRIPMSMIDWAAFYGPDNTKAPRDIADGYYFGARHLFGLDLEVVEPACRHFARQTLQYPAYLQPRPVETGPLGRLLALQLLVENAALCIANLERAIAPASRSAPRETTTAKRRQISLTLGGLELHFQEPLFDDHSGHKILRQCGSGAATLIFSCPDLEGALAAMPAAERTRFQALKNGFLLPCRPQLGFDVELQS